MRNMILKTTVAVLAGLLLTVSHSRADAETLIGNNIDSRVIVGVQADSAGVQAFMPEGWSAIGFPRGPLTGANLLVSFVDGVLMVDADGKPLDPASRRAIVLLGLGKQVDGDGVRIFVLRSYSTEPAEIDPYGVNIPADIARTQSLGGAANAGRDSADTWSMTMSGGSLDMILTYTTGRRSWSAAEAKSFSAAQPDFYRIYRYESLTDVAMSRALEKSLDGQFELVSTVPELAAIFDGSEETVAILDIPVRVREVFLP